MRKILDHYPLDKACLVGCGVTTGWGSAVYAAKVQPGDDVVVIGIGGLGSAAIQGARLAGAERIFAIDPVPFKRDMATKFGATHTAASVEEAIALVNEVTWGKNAEKVICTMGVGDGTLIESILPLTAKGGRHLAHASGRQNSAAPCQVARDSKRGAKEVGPENGRNPPNAIRVREHDPRGSAFSALPWDHRRPSDRRHF